MGFTKRYSSSDLATATAMSSCTSVATRYSSVLSLISSYMMIAPLPSGRCILICRITRHERQKTLFDVHFVAACATDRTMACVAWSGGGGGAAEHLGFVTISCYVSVFYEDL